METEVQNCVWNVHSNISEYAVLFQYNVIQHNNIVTRGIQNSPSHYVWP